MDFFRIKERSVKKDLIEIYPAFKICRYGDLMIRGGAFYAIWDEEAGLWSTDEYDVARLVDQELWEYFRTRKIDPESKADITVKTMSDFSKNSWKDFKSYTKQVSDNYHDLDTNVTFLNTVVKKKDYVSKRLNYPLLPGEYPAYDEMMSTLYDEDERAKIEWAIGAIIAGDAKDIQKFIVLYGSAGTGKSTILNIIQKLFDGYYTTFEAKSLASSNNSFSTEVFRSNPLVAIQHDGDLSKIEDNSKLNSIISHEFMSMQEKYKSSYTSRVNSFLFMGTNRPVKITDAKSGIIRRLIDVKPSGRKIPVKRYHILVSQIDFELGAIASHCLEVYLEMGKNFYAGYRPFEMMYQTDVFFNFVESCFDIFKEENGVTLKKAYDLYKEYCEDSLVEYKLARHKFREELKNYFEDFKELTRVDGKVTRSYYMGFLTSKFIFSIDQEEERPLSINLDSTTSVIDELYSSCKAQYANDGGKPEKKWVEVTTTLGDLDTSRLHYVQLPGDHIVVDFDLVDENGEKSVEKNLEAASIWPPTYSEYSKSGNGLHLHYIYEGDTDRLCALHSPGIEIKRFVGDAAIRRRLSKCNNISIATISGGLPLKGEKMVDSDIIRSEKSLRELIARNLRKEIHPGTKPSMDFIFKILEDAYNSGLKYDVSDMRNKISTFANQSTNQAAYCIKLISRMKFKSEEVIEAKPETDSNTTDIIFFDIEVFPNLFVVNWKVIGEGRSIVRMINPTSSDIEALMNHKLVGFNCRRYDNHILYGAYLGYNNEEIYKLSKRIINNEPGAMFGAAYNISYTDVYDFASEKQSLKKWEIELGLHHQELGLPWDEPVPEEKWNLVAEYCDNDVLATEAVFNARKGDWAARQILAELAGLSVNDTTNTLSTRIIFGTNRNPQDQFNYRNLDELFPGYLYEYGKSVYRGEIVGEGGYVYVEEGMYENVAVLDVASMHPSSIIAENLFGDKYTAIFKSIVDMRIDIKHGDIESAKTRDSRFAPYLTESMMDDLAYALKIVINSIYGLTAAKFPNAFKDPRNKDNIVAKRGALFMVDLKHAVQEKGFQVIHIKTDSIKIPNATEDIVSFCYEFGLRYGYTFEHEATYEKICLVNKSVYIAKYQWAAKSKYIGTWSAVGPQFAHPYVFKTLFSKEKVTFEDLCETKSVTEGAMYLDFNEEIETADEHAYTFVGRCGRFTPIKSGCGGGLLLRNKADKYYAVTGTKGYRWMESELVIGTSKEEDVDLLYFEELVRDAISNLDKYGESSRFLNHDGPPWYGYICEK